MAMEGTLHTDHKKETPRQGDISLGWPLLLKPLTYQSCHDADIEQSTHPVQIVNITDLLAGAEGSATALYITGAYLADLTTFQKLISFDLEEFCTKEDLFSALTHHLGLELKVRQRSQEPTVVSTVCRKELTDALPSVRGKRHSFNGKALVDAQKKLEAAMIIANNIM